MLEKLRLKKIEFATGSNPLKAMKFTMSDNQESPVYGVFQWRTFKKIFDDYAHFTKIQVLSNKEQIDGLRLYGHEKKPTFEFIGKIRQGKWFEIEINDEEHIIGVTLLVDNEATPPRPKAISFTLYKP